MLIFLGAEPLAVLPLEADQLPAQLGLSDILLEDLVPVFFQGAHDAVKSLHGIPFVPGIRQVSPSPGGRGCFLLGTTAVFYHKFRHKIYGNG